LNRTGRRGPDNNLVVYDAAREKNQHLLGSVYLIAIRVLLTRSKPDPSGEGKVDASKNLANAPPF